MDALTIAYFNEKGPKGWESKSSFLVILFLKKLDSNNQQKLSISFPMAFDSH